MMNFIKQMVETERSKAIAHISLVNKIKNYQAIPVMDGKYWLSIQASTYHYCTPRETLDDLNQYTSMELAVMSNEGEFCALPDFIELEDYFDGVIYSYVPVELIEKLYLGLAGGDL